MWREERDTDLDRTISFPMRFSEPIRTASSDLAENRWTSTHLEVRPTGNSHAGAVFRDELADRVQPSSYAVDKRQSGNQVLLVPSSVHVHPLTQPHSCSRRRSASASSTSSVLSSDLPFSAATVHETRTTLSLPRRPSARHAASSVRRASRESGHSARSSSGDAHHQVPWCIAQALTNA